MAPLPFNMAVMEFLAAHRDPLLTKFFLLATFAGEIEGYILIVTLIYVAFDKSLAVRLSVLVLLTMSLNHVLKIIIRNPRPFVLEGTYFEKWAVSADNAKELVREFSTPSGHAMAGAAFYGYLFSWAKNPYARVAACAAVLLIGLSRPYLGVHYVEDVALGWIVGLLIAFVAFTYGGKIGDAWARAPLVLQAGILAGSTALLWVVTVAAGGWQIDEQPRAFLGYAGLLTGVVVGQTLELRRVNFDPRSGSVSAKALRYALSVGIVMLTLLALGVSFEALADRSSIAGYILQYVRYTTAGIAGIFVAPLLFTTVGLARRRTPDRAIKHDA